MAIEQIVHEAAPVVSASIAIFGITFLRWRTYVQHELIRSERDNNECLAPFQHDCGGVLTVHHIDPRGRGGSEDPTNKLTVCEAAQKLLHGPLKGRFLNEMRDIAKARTELGRQNGNEFEFPTGDIKLPPMV